MIRNFARITNYFNRLEARKDWQRLAEYAVAIGRADLVERFAPPENAGWRRIDKASARLRTALGLPPPQPFAPTSDQIPP